MSVSYGGDSITFADSSVQSSGWTGMRNRIMNGGMVIDQRNAGASFTPTAGSYSVDRWTWYVSQSSKLTTQRSSVAPAGFSNSMLVTSSSAYSVTSTDYNFVRQPIEGFNVADLGWGTANAQAVTLSFWVRSSLTGTWGGQILSSDSASCYVYSYTINQANTWEYKTITIPGPNTYTWYTDNRAGMYVSFNLGAGSSRLVGSTGWVTIGSGADSVTGSQSLVGTSGATWYVTGVQLERGSTASSFEYRPYGTELALCYRYYQVYGSVGSTGTQGDMFSGFYRNSSTVFMPVAFPTIMRSTPSFTSISATGAQFSSQTQDTTVTGFQISNTPTPRTAFVQALSSAAFAAGNGVVYSNNGTTTNAFSFSAEL
jgi:hypothetical protein